jgi:hypothetical protein
VQHGGADPRRPCTPPNLALAEASVSSCTEGQRPHVHHETRLLATAAVGLSAAILGVAATRDTGCGAMTDRTIPVIFWTVMGGLLVSLLVLVLAS